MALVIVQIQDQHPLCAYSAACVRGGVADAERAQSRYGRAELLRVTVLPSVDNRAVPACHRVVVARLECPVCEDAFDGGDVAEVEVGIALDIHRGVGAGNRVDRRRLAVDGQIEALARDSEVARVRGQVVGEHVRQQWYRRAAEFLRDARVLDVYGGDNQSASTAIAY